MVAGDAGRRRLQQFPSMGKSASLVDSRVWRRRGGSGEAGGAVACGRRRCFTAEELGPRLGLREQRDAEEKKETRERRREVWESGCARGLGLFIGSINGSD